MQARVILPVVLLSLAISTTTVGQNRPTNAGTFNDFTGDFVLTGATGDLRFDPHKTDQPTITLTRTPDGIQIKRTDGGREETMLLPLDGRSVEFTTFEGNPATAKLRVKGKHLEITEDIQVAGISRAASWHIHSVDHWGLSHDLKILKICGSADSESEIAHFTKSGCGVFKRH